MRTLLLAAALLALAAAPAGAKRACAGPDGAVDPIRAARIFLERVVERTNPAAGYRFVTSAARHGITCESWTRGRIPFEAYRHIDWSRSTYRRVAVGTGQIVLRVSLRSSEHAKARAFLLELRQHGPLWQVGFWSRG